jgi:serine/threonine protein kinase
MPLSAGTRLGPYEILAPIGAGMGEVYRARDTKLKREVALKVLPDFFASDPERMARFQREVQGHQPFLVLVAVVFLQKCGQPESEGKDRILKGRVTRYSGSEDGRGGTHVAAPCKKLRRDLCPRMFDFPFYLWRTHNARFRPESPPATEALPPSPKSRAQPSPACFPGVELHCHPVSLIGPFTR